MKNYKKVLLALEQDATPTSKQNKFVKISIETEDVVLKELCQNIAKMYSYYIKPRLVRNIRS